RAVHSASARGAAVPTLLGRFVSLFLARLRRTNGSYQAAHLPAPRLKVGARETVVTEKFPGHDDVRAREHICGRRFAVGWRDFASGFAFLPRKPLADQLQFLSALCSR